MYPQLCFAEDYYILLGILHKNIIFHILYIEITFYHIHLTRAFVLYVAYHAHIDILFYFEVYTFVGKIQHRAVRQCDLLGERERPKHLDYLLLTRKEIIQFCIICLLLKFIIVLRDIVSNFDK